MIKKIMIIGIIVSFLTFMPGILAFTNESPIPSCNTQSGATLYVGGSGPGNYTTIQDAIDNASNGDTVYVYRQEPYYWENVVINKAISLVGDQHRVSLQAYDQWLPAIRIVHDYVKVDGFRIMYEGPGSLYAFIVKDVSNVNITNCDLYTGMCTISFNNVSNSSIFHNFFDLIEIYEGGIRLSGGNGNIIQENHFDNHFGYDLVITDNAKNMLIANNNFSFPCDFCGITAIGLPGAGVGNKIIENNFFIPVQGGTPSYWNKNFYGGRNIRQNHPVIRLLPKIIPPTKWKNEKINIDWRPAVKPFDYW